MNIARWARPLAEAVRAMDPRVKIASALVLGICMLHSGVPGLIVNLVFFSLLAAAASGAWTLGATPGGMAVIRIYIWFVLFWMVFKGAVDALEGLQAAEVLMGSLTMGVRLMGLLLMGLCLALTTSARKMGRAFSWFMRPFIRERSWRVGLALALMVHYLPLVMLTSARVKEGIRSRGVELSSWKRGLVTAQASLRDLSVGTWNQTLAVVSRGLDRPEAWEGPFPPCARSIVCGVCAVLAGIGLAVI